MHTENFSQIPAHFLRENKLFPLKNENGFVLVASSRPENIEALDRLSILLRAPVEVKKVSDEEMKRLLDGVNDSNGHSPAEILKELESQVAALPLKQQEGRRDLMDLANKPPVVKLVNRLIIDAVTRGATDIHFQALEDCLKIRYRVDGILHDVLSCQPEYQPAVVSRVKVMAGMDVAERRLPQDGRTTVELGEKCVDVRVSVIPTAFGERAHLRLLDKRNLLLGLNKLGVAEDDCGRLRSLLKRPQGIILSVGPTGSGKTTMLYACLSEINSPGKNILTIEDPIEYQLAGISQMQVKPRIGLGFAEGLRSVLRQDPDVLMVGEIRDLETARIAVHSALTGHLVLSTLHTNDAAEAITRLLDMGVEPYLISSCLSAVVGQRLVRLVCGKCGGPRGPAAGVPGCDECFNTGYSGRTGVYEIAVIDDDVRHLIMSRADTKTIREKLKQNGFRTMKEEGLQKVSRGLTTVEELTRVM